MAILVNDRTRDALLKAAAHPHNLIFSGAKGIGKHTMAVEIAKRYLGTSDIYSHPDFTEIADDGGAIKKERIDEMISLSSFKPMSAANRVFIIDGAQRMTEAAQNALLKTLEDEDEMNVFMLINQGRLLGTIRSRCTEVGFGFIAYDRLPEGTDRYAYLAAASAPGAIKSITENDKLMGIIRQMPQAVRSRKELLTLLGELNPKDPDNFFENASEDEKLWLITFIRWYLLLSYAPGMADIIGVDKGILMTEADAKVQQMALTASRMAFELSEGTLTKNSFFDYLLKLTEEVE